MIFYGVLKNIFSSVTTVTIMMEIHTTCTTFPHKSGEEAGMNWPWPHNDHIGDRLLGHPLFQALLKNISLLRQRPALWWKENRQCPGEVPQPSIRCWWTQGNQAINSTPTFVFFCLIWTSPKIVQYDQICYLKVHGLENWRTTFYIKKDLIFYLNSQRCSATHTTFQYSSFTWGSNDPDPASTKAFNK